MKRTFGYHPSETAGHTIIQAPIGKHAKVALRSVILPGDERDLVLRYELSFEAGSGPRFVDMLDVFPATAEMEAMVDAFEAQVLNYRLQMQQLHMSI